MIRITLLSIIILLSFLKFAASSEKIVFIDLNYIFYNSTAGKNLNSQIIVKNNNLDKKIEKYRKELDLKQKNLLAKKNVLSQDQYNTNIKDLEIEIKDINLKISKEKKNLSLFKSNIEKEFFLNLNLIIQKYSIDKSIDIVLKKKDLLMAKKNLNISEDILILFNDKIKEIIIK